MPPGKETIMSDNLYAEYNGAIGALMAARKRYADVCETQGLQSWAAEQAHEYVAREVEHLDRVRERYDDVARRRPAGERDV
jgi:hypothetical protein